MRSSQNQLREIGFKGIKLQNKRYKKTFRMMNQNIVPFSSTQTLFSSTNKMSLKNISNQYSNQKYQRGKQLYQTFGNTNWGKWVRPESKHACRKMFARPQTSKGYRTSQICNNNFLIQQKKPNSRRKQLRKQSQSYKQNNRDPYQEIQIIVNKKFPEKKGESMHRNKFETDLDDQFLQLFAD